MHLIDESNNRANMAYVGATPWHGLGQVLEPDSPLEVWAVQAGMSHTIERTPVRFDSSEGPDGLAGFLGTMPGRDVLYRSDNREPLAVVSSRYQIVQPGEVLEFYREIVGATGDYQLETAGCLDGGRKYWALAKYRQAMDLGGDIVKPYLLLATSCDGTMATTAQHTTVRVVCNNTLQMSLGAESADAVRIAHSTKFNGQAVRQALGVEETIDTFAQEIEGLINKAMTRQQSAEIFVELVAKRDEKGEITNEEQTKKQVEAMLRSLIHGPGAHLETAHNTAWGTLNAVTHHVDFNANSRSDNNRFKSAQFGEGARLKRQAFELLAAA